MNDYTDILANIPQIIDESKEKIEFFQAATKLSKPAFSNKKNGNRTWKPTELQAVLQVLKKETKAIDDYIFLVKNMDYLIKEKGFLKGRLLQKVGMSAIQSFQRKHSEKQGFRTWKAEEVKKIVEYL